MKKNKKTYEVAICESITKPLFHEIGRENGRAGLQEDEHRCEGYIQEKIADLLRTKLPDVTLLTCNKKLTKDKESERLIPDILVHRIGGGIWGVIELKTLLLEDDLSVVEVNDDLKKLCTYKRDFPATAAVFMLVGSRAKLFNIQRKIAWDSLKIKYEPELFIGPSPQPQELETKGFVALPCGSFNVDSFDLCIFMWEVVHKGQMVPLSSTYRFTAEMA